MMKGDGRRINLKRKVNQKKTRKQQFPSMAPTIIEARDCSLPAFSHSKPLRFSATSQRCDSSMVACGEHLFMTTESNGAVRIVAVDARLIAATCLKSSAEASLSEHLATSGEFAVVPVTSADECVVSILSSNGRDSVAISAGHRLFVYTLCPDGIPTLTSNWDFSEHVRACRFITPSKLVVISESGRGYELSKFATSLPTPFSTTVPACRSFALAPNGDLLAPSGNSIKRVSRESGSCDTCDIIDMPESLQSEETVIQSICSIDIQSGRIAFTASTDAGMTVATVIASVKDSQIVCEASSENEIFLSADWTADSFGVCTYVPELSVLLTGHSLADALALYRRGDRGDAWQCLIMPEGKQLSCSLVDGDSTASFLRQITVVVLNEPIEVPRGNELTACRLVVFTTQLDGWTTVHYADLPSDWKIINQPTASAQLDTGLPSATPVVLTPTVELIFTAATPVVATTPEVTPTEPVATEATPVMAPSEPDVTSTPTMTAATPVLASSEQTPVKPAASGGLFGAQPVVPGGLFAAAPVAPGKSLFGSFGATATPAPTGGLFGQPGSAATPAAGGLFGQSALGTTPAPQATGGLFGQSAATTTSAPPAGGLFGQPASATTTPATGLFGQPASSTTTPGSGLFGQPAAPSAGAPSGGLLGQPAATGAPTGGLFGSSVPAGGSVFGAFGAPATLGTAVSSSKFPGDAISTPPDATPPNEPVGFGESTLGKPVAKSASQSPSTKPVMKAPVETSIKTPVAAAANPPLFNPKMKPAVTAALTPPMFDASVKPVNKAATAPPTDESPKTPVKAAVAPPMFDASVRRPSSAAPAPPMFDALVKAPSAAAGTPSGVELDESLVKSFEDALKEWELVAKSGSSTAVKFDASSIPPSPIDTIDADKQVLLEMRDSTRDLDARIRSAYTQGSSHISETMAGLESKCASVTARIDEASHKARKILGRGRLSSLRASPAPQVFRPSQPSTPTASPVPIFHPLPPSMRKEHTGGFGLITPVKVTPRKERGLAELMAEPMRRDPYTTRLSMAALKTPVGKKRLSLGDVLAGKILGSPSATASRPSTPEKAAPTVVSGGHGSAWQLMRQVEEQRKQMETLLKEVESLACTQ